MQGGMVSCLIGDLLVLRRLDAVESKRTMEHRFKALLAALSRLWSKRLKEWTRDVQVMNDNSAPLL